LEHPWTNHKNLGKQMGKPNKKLKNQWKNPLKNLSKNEKHNFSFALSLPAILGFTPHRAHLARPPEAAQ
jgi:hypothetical protein